MSEKDYAISSVGLPQVGKVANKPRYLIQMNALNTTKNTKTLVNFIAMDRPDLQMGFIAVKGVYSDETEEDISAQFNDIIAATPKESILDLLLPTHRVHSIRSLVFNANKPSTLIK
jgi:hypothetical protein